MGLFNVTGWLRSWTCAPRPLQSTTLVVGQVQPGLGAHHDNGPLDRGFSPPLNGGKHWKMYLFSLFFLATRSLGTFLASLARDDGNRNLPHPFFSLRQGRISPSKPLVGNGRSGGPGGINSLLTETFRPMRFSGCFVRPSQGIRSAVRQLDQSRYTPSKRSLIIVWTRISDARRVIGGVPACLG